jgi:hypothetical protein
MAPAMPAAAVTSVTPPVPGVVSLVGRQRNPADVSETETYAQAETAVTVVAEERHESRPPVMVSVAVARIPTPAVVLVVEPTPVVVRRPSPGLIAHPRPAVVVKPAPAAMAVRSPTDGGGGEPTTSVSAYVLPAPVAVEIFRPVNAPAHVTTAFGLFELFVPALVPTIPVVLRFRLRGPKFRRIAVPPNVDGTSLAQGLRSRDGNNLGFAPVDGDDRVAVGGYLDSIVPPFERTYGHLRSLDVDIRFAMTKLAVGRQAPRQLHPKTPLRQLYEVNLRRFAESQQVAGIELNCGSRERTGG